MKRCNHNRPLGARGLRFRIWAPALMLWCMLVMAACSALAPAVPAIERATVQPGAWELPTGMIRDYPRFAWRGAMLDVARHFFSVDDVKRYIDLLAMLKMNRLHLHLADDQGWRIEIKSWPQLTTR